MSPKAAQYKANSIVYFKGDINERVFILKTGRVVLRYNDIETGQEMQDVIKTGEFFGVRSALGKYPREETAVVLQDAAMVAFSVPEFEAVAMQNTRIIMKMLKVFSTQLRRIHKQVQNLLSTGKQVNPETGLFNIGQYYLKSSNYQQALYAFQRYLTYYPSGKYASEANEKIQMASKYAASGGGNSGGGSPSGISSGSAVVAPAPVAASSGGAPGELQGREMSDGAKSYYNAVSLFSQQKYQQALDEFKVIVNDGMDREYGIKSLFEVGRCLFSLNDFDSCIKHFTTMIQKYPKHPELLDALYYLGTCYEKKDDSERAGGFYNKIISMSKENMPVNRKAKKALRNLGGN